MHNILSDNRTFSLRCFKKQVSISFERSINNFHPNFWPNFRSLWFIAGSSSSAAQNGLLVSHLLRSSPASLPTQGKQIRLCLSTACFCSFSLCFVMQFGRFASHSRKKIIKISIDTAFAKDFRFVLTRCVAFCNHKMVLKVAYLQQIVAFVTVMGIVPFLFHINRSLR